MAIETTSTLAYMVQVYYEKRFLENLKQNLVFADFSRKYTIPSGSGPTIYFSKYDVMAASTTALTEGTVPSEAQLTDSRVTAIVAQYGQFLKVSDFILATHIAGPNQFLDQAVDELSYAAKKSLDTLVRNAFGSGLTAAANITYANSKTALSAVIGSTDTAMAADVRKIVYALRSRDVPTWDAQHYIGVIGAGQEYGLLSETATGTWVDSNKYASPEQIFKGEIGKLYGVRFYVSNNLSTLSQSGTISECYFFGKDAMGTIDLAATEKADKRLSNINIYIKRPGSSGAADPLNQIATVGYKVNFAAQRLDDNRVQLYKVGQGV